MKEKENELPRLKGEANRPYNLIVRDWLLAMLEVALEDPKNKERIEKLNKEYPKK